MANPSFGQADFSAGLWRGRKAPQSAAYDAVNALIDDEGSLARRGASAYKSGADSTAAPEGLVDVNVAGGQRTVFWSETAEDIYVLDSNDSSVVSVATSGTAWRKLSRGVVVGGLLWLPGVKVGGSAALKPVAYGGSRKTADTALQTVTVVNGSTTVTGTSTSWTTTVDAGMILEGVGGLITGQRGIVRSVTSNTQLELVDPWAGSSNSATTAIFERFDSNGGLVDSANTDAQYLATAGQRLLVTQGNRVYFSPANDPFGGSRTTDFHQLPNGAVIVGADALHDIALIFTTAGVWAIENLALDPVDDAGNPQHQVEQVTKDLILWADPGIAAWEGQLLVPAVDDVHLLAVDGSTTPLSDGIRPLYRSYVNAGYQPGMADVHRGHYFLPIVNGTTLIDTLVCRLDRPTQTPSGQVIRPWTRWAGHAAGVAYAQRVGSTTRSPKLLGLAGQRVTELTATLDGQGATDADASAITFTATTNDVPLGDGTATRVRARYTATGSSPAVAVEYSSDQDAGAFTALTVKGEQGGAAGWGASDGSKYQFANIIKKRDRIRFRFTLSGTATSFVLRAIEVLSRASGKQ